MSNDLRDGLCRVRLVQFSVSVTKKIDVANIEYFCRVQQFILAYLAERFQTGILSFITKPSTLAPRRGHEIRFDSFSSIFRKYSAIAARFVIGIRQNGHQLKRTCHVYLFFLGMYISPSTM